jgi:starch phosphorylase
MKLALNGALTIGTLDGANLEMRDAIGSENMFIFGHRSEQIAELRNHGYHPRRYYDADPELRTVLDDIATGRFLDGPTDRFRPLFDSLMNEDRYFLLADFADYVVAQGAVESTCRDIEEWTRRAIRNVSGIGELSSDRAVAEYATRIWRLASLAEH